jgi:hypothetical protein
LFDPDAISMTPELLQQHCEQVTVSLLLKAPCSKRKQEPNPKASYGFLLEQGA